MAFKMFLLAFSVLLIARVTLGENDCGFHRFSLCERPEEMKAIPREVPDFNNYCVAMKSHLRCIKEFQDDCGTDRVVFFETPEIFEATYDTFSEICEEGTLLNTVATENLKCFNETFGKTRCHEESDQFLEPFIKEVRENEELEPKFSYSCLKSALVYDCVLSAISDNCGQLVGEAALEVLRRSKTLENACSVRGAKSVLDELDNLDLSEGKKRSLTQLLEKLVEETND
ncbi:hypothetical protein AVEN_275245-1 [Araneus ventricosus]|uniref:DUF19 domain-containing protein n=1 Tax=Araneus ventricosus TaxID=182803 RepID=A0A4Y2JKS6_ARAVE|nr:hypothetical protein AVEN_275245-1 [Araneus ventricosus]